MIGMGMGWCETINPPPLRIPIGSNNFNRTIMFHLEIYLFKHYPKIARFFWRDTKGPMRFRN
jgi:hypothetical protein